MDNFLPVFEAKALTKIPFIHHGFFTRQGGVSQGIYQSLNIGLGSADDANHVAQNHVLIAAHFGVDRAHLLMPYQCHSSDAVHISAPFEGVRPKADALVSRVPGLVLAVATADCMPVLFADHAHGVIGAAHAGWRGAYGGILENTVAAMETLGAKRDTIIAALGPCIGPKNYLVGEEFFTHFINQSSDNQRYFIASSQENHYFFNLGSYNIGRLAQAGIKCEYLDLCTYEKEELFFSYRRMSHRSETDYGRQISAIAIFER